MRTNLPVTNVETRVRADQYLISKTDRKGIITYANAAFINISGYSREELIGSPHNLVRHPDMPPEAFADLWSTIQAGEPWMGVVKNRRKDGGFYWVLASVSPIVEEGEVIGYASVRIKPSRAQIDEAEALYQQINDGSLTGRRLEGGKFVPTGWRRVLQALKAPFSGGLQAGILRLAILFSTLIGTATWFAVTGGMTEDQRPWVLSGLTLGTAGAFWYGWAMSKRILQPLKSVLDVVRQIAAGNLVVQVDTDDQEHSGTIHFYVEMMRRALLGIAHDVQESASITTRMAEALSLDNRNLLIRTEAQAAALLHTSASVNELSQCVNQNADSAVLAKKLSEDSVQIATRGGEVVDAVVHSMERIHESSTKIGDIVTLIESIAFQTNILALNAAVEAARAGEAGRGFAVVATEVRNLAQKSAQAAKEIKALIGESVARMEDGAKEAGKAGETMEEILRSVTRVAELVNEITVVSQQQTRGLTDMNQAVAELESATQENSRFGQQLSDNIARLTQDAHTLRLTIEVLNTGSKAVVWDSGTREREPVAMLQ